LEKTTEEAAELKKKTDAGAVAAAAAAAAAKLKKNADANALKKKNADVPFPPPHLRQSASGEGRKMQGIYPGATNVAPKSVGSRTTNGQIGAIS
jgi:hypothetical protein